MKSKHNTAVAACPDIRKGSGAMEADTILKHGEIEIPKVEEILIHKYHG